jgi:hypothetical protein
VAEGATERGKVTYVPSRNTNADCFQDRGAMFRATSFSFLVSLGGVRLSPLGTSAAVGLLYQPRMIDGDDYGACLQSTHCSLALL